MSGAVSKLLMREAEHKKNKETLARLQAPSHVVKSHFSEHQKVKGYLQDLGRENFFGSDRLMSYETMFGTVQLGYDTKRETTFLFANMKTSIYDTVASGYQKEMSEDTMRKSMKSESENVAFSSKRKTNAASVFYKKDAKPWSEETLRPYLNRMNLETFAKTMPFLQAKKDRAERAKMVREDLDLKAQAREAMSMQNEEQLSSIRAEQHLLLRRMETVGSIIYRKSSGASMFFRKVNFSFDYQKQEIFNHYKRIKGQALQATNVASEPTDEEED